VLAVLRGRRLRMSALADHLGLERSSLSGLVDRAQRRGLVQRTAAAGDGRVVEVQLSRAGVTLAERVTTDIACELTPLTGALDPRERLRLQSLLERMLGSPAPSIGPAVSS
jgi:DNA-binding MarR family transcriptional regulator